MILVLRKTACWKEGRLMLSSCRPMNGNVLDYFVLFSVCVFSFFFPHHLIFKEHFSMLTRRSKPSQQLVVRVYITRFQQLRHCMLDGRRLLGKTNTRHFILRWRRQQTSSRSTTTKLQLPTRISFVWVRYYFILIVFCQWWSLILVLHPNKKMSHFKKYWSVAPQVDVKALLQEKVDYLVWFNRII
jgi:hypothetical protein